MILSNVYETAPLGQCRRSEIFSVLNYSDYVQFKEFNVITGSFTNAIRSGKDVWLILFKEDEDQRSSLIRNIAHML